jgi:hypothetical protein
MQMRFSQPVVAALVAVALSGCPEALTEERAEFTTLQAEWTKRIERSKTGLTELQGKVKALPPGDGAAEEKATLDRTVGNAEKAVTDAEAAVAKAKTDIQAGLDTGKGAQAAVALSTARTAADGALARAQSLVTAGNTALEAYVKKGAELKAAAEAAKAQAAAFATAAGEAVKKKGASFEVAGVVFAADAVDAVKSKTAMESLVGFFKTCDALKADVMVVAGGEAADLGTKRAEALKTALTGAGVDAKVFGKVEGKVEAEAAEKVTLTIAAPCK